MQKTISNLILGVALVGVVACSKASHAADNPKQDAAVTQVYESLDVPSGSYVMDKSHGYVTFSYLHKGLSNPVLRFNDVDATLVLDAAKPENSEIDVTIQAANIDSGVAKFDAHLNSADFFNTAENSEITFISTSFTRDSATSGQMVGDLTMMGVTKPITFDVTLVGTADGKKPAIGVEGTGSLLRSDFGLGKFVPFVGDKVNISISAEFNKRAG